LAILFELIANGYTDDEIVDVFKNQEDFDEKKTRYIITHARKQGYKPFSRERLKEIVKEVD
jgi:DNA primase large subunit